ncbi:MAG: FadR family transcriptional regulator [Chloroflexi bacterium]|nr:FadR family transcriptional regulator [Chloroflexota bacterium]
MRTYTRRVLDGRPYRLEPIQRVDVYREVLARIEAYIRENQLRPGDRLPSDRELSEWLGVSRPVVRMAIKSLESLGRVEARVGSGTYIRESSQVLAVELTRGLEVGWPFLHQLQAARSPIELQILEAAFSHRTPQNLARLQAVVDARARQLAEEDPGEGVPNLNLSFEATLGEMCGNEVLRRLQAVLHAMWVQALVAIGEAPGDRELLQHEHDRVLECFRAGDLAGALAAYREHLRVGRAAGPTPLRKKAATRR